MDGHRVDRTDAIVAMALPVVLFAARRLFSCRIPSGPRLPRTQPVAAPWPTGFGISQRQRKRVEEPFGWGKLIGQIRQVKQRSKARVNALSQVTMLGWNPIRMRNILVTIPRSHDPTMTPSGRVSAYRNAARCTTSIGTTGGSKRKSAPSEMDDELSAFFNSLLIRNQYIH